MTMPQLARATSPGRRLRREPPPGTAPDAAPTVAAVEAVLVAAVAAALGVPTARIDPGQAIASLGTDSLAAIEICHQVETSLEVECSVWELFEAGSLGALAVELAGRRAAADSGRQEAARQRTVADHPGPTPDPAAGDSSVPLSWGQQGLWFLYRLNPGSAAYNVFFAARLLAAPPELELARRFERLAARHAVLRTVLAEQGGIVRQRVGETSAIDLRSVAAAGWSAAALRERITTEAHRPFVLDGGALFRVVLFERGAEPPVLLLAAHHVAADLASLELLLADLGAPACTGGAAAVPAAAKPPAYADFVAWQRGMLAGAAGDRLRRYWSARLAGLPALDLPLDRPRPPAPAGAGGSLVFELPATAAGAALARAAAAVPAGGTTMNVVLLAVFAVLLHRLTGQDDFAVGSPASGRTRPDWRGLAGYLVNLLVLRTRFAAAPSFGALLAQVHTTVLEALLHQDYPLVRLLADLEPERGKGQPLFQLAFVFQQPRRLPRLAGFLVDAGRGADRDETLQIGDLRLAPFAVPRRASEFDLTLTTTVVGERLVCDLRYSTELLDRTTVARLARHYVNLVAAAAATDSSGTAVADLPMLAAGERAQLLREWSGRAALRPVEATLDRLFARQAAAAPERVAVELGEHALTYGELALRAARLARELRARGVGPEVAVGLAAERSLAMIVALVGIVAAGGAYVPLDLAYPRERLLAMIDNAGISLLLVAGPAGGEPPAALPDGLRDALPAALRVLHVESAGDLREPPRRAPVPHLPSPDGLAYVMYTSGSTGGPKGVAVTHRGVVRLVRDASYAELGPNEVFLQLAPISFDAATLEIWGPLLHGGRLLLAPPATPSPAELAALLTRHGVTTLWLTAGLFHLMADEHLADLARVRQLLAGGDVLSPAHARRAAGALGQHGHRLINGYGPTESTTFTCCHTVAPEAPAGTPIPIGRPIAGTCVAVADRHLQPAAIGAPGELLIGGSGLARGYHRQPAATAERFVPDPFSEAPGARLYHSGDLVRYLPDGTLLFLGRSDRQIKVRGFRIEPAEVEAALVLDPRVRQALVLALPAREAGGRRLVAYVVPAEGAGLDVAELRRRACASLPEPMVPAAFVLLSALPLTPNGKVDHAALPVPRAAAPAPGAAPLSPVEEVLAGIWSELLGLDGAARESEFFALGGNSLLALQLAARVREALGVTLAISELFQSATLGEMASAVERARRRDVADLAPMTAAPAAPPQRRVPPLASFAQERLWLLTELAAGGATYNVPAAVHLHGRLSLAALGAALRAIVCRHEVLRTTFAAIDGEPRQIIAPAPRAHLPLADLTALARDRGAEEARRLGAEEAGRGFDLRRGPLLRTCLLRLDALDHRLLLTTHHIVFDGWSLALFARELGAFYTAALDAPGRYLPAAVLPPLAWQYADFAAWQRGVLQGEALAHRLAFWRRQLAGAPDALDLPADRPRPAHPGRRGARRPLQLSPRLAADLRALGRRQRATLFMTVLAGFAELLRRYTGQADLVLGVPVAGRDTAAVAELIGFFVNTIPVRADLGGGPSATELLHRLRAATLAAYDHQDLPFVKLVEELAPRRDLARNPLFDVLFNLRPAPPALTLPDLAVTAEEVPAPVARFDLSLTLEEAADGGLPGAVLYSRELFDAARIERLAGHLQALLAGMAEAPGRPLPALDMLSRAERHQLTVEGDATAEPAEERPVHLLFAAAARRHAEITALRAAGRSLSYGELAARSSRLAAELLSRGLRPGERVALLAGAGFAQITALLAVTAAGGCVLGLDPALPQARLLAALDAARPALVLVDEVNRRVHRPLLTAAEETLGCRVADAAPPSDAPPSGAGAPGAPKALTPAPGHPFAAASTPAADDPVYLVFTSGSTGAPKGILQSHRGLSQFTGWRMRHLGLRPGCRVAQWAALGYDAAFYEIFAALGTGATLVLADPDTRFDPRAALAWVAAEGITHLKAVPSFGRQLLTADNATTPALAALDRLELAGEPLPPALAAAWLARFPLRPRLDNLYGPSETILATWCTVGPARSPGRSVPVGRAIDGRQILVLDAAGAPCPLGVPGEIYIRSPYLTLGYAGLPEETARRFAASPLAPADPVRSYRTGDFGWWRPDGQLDFAGRRDGQVKIRGIRIEIEEIEAELARHPAVAECALRVADTAAGERELVAYVVPRQAIEPGELRAALLERLPAAMVPAAWVLLAALPRTSTRKIDRGALAAAGEPARIQSAYVAPRTPTEAALAGLFAELLRLPRIGVHDNFFAAGGHSLLASRALARLRATFGVDLPLRTFFLRPTVAELAVAVAEQRAAALGAADLSRLLARLEGLSPDQARSQLAVGGGTAAPLPAPAAKGDRP